MKRMVNNINKLLVGIVPMFITEITYAQERPNIVIMIADDCSYNDWGCYGSVDSKTPNIDAFAKEGLKFNNCFQAVAMSSPTRHCLYTGVYPVKSGAYPNHTFVNDTIKSFVQYFGEQGYVTALAGKTHVSPPSVFSYQYLGGYKDEQGGTFQWEKINDFLDQNRKNPFFLVMASHEPHGPYVNGDPSQWEPNKLTLPPMYVDTPELRKAFAGYLAEIAVFDSQVGKICNMLKVKGIEENTIFILLSEQGNGFPFAKWTCYKQGLQSAMLVRWPGKIKGGTQTDAMVEYVDVIPTLLDIIGQKPSPQCDGKSFYKVLQGKRDTHKKYVFGIQTTRGINNGSEYYGSRSVRSKRYSYIINLTPEAKFMNAITQGNSFWKSWIREAEYDKFAKKQVDKYQHRPMEELYDMQKDPYEMVNLVDNSRYQDVKKELRKQLFLWMEKQGDKGQETELAAFDHMVKKQIPKKKNRGNIYKNIKEQVK